MIPLLILENDALILFLPAAYRRRAINAKLVGIYLSADFSVQSY